MKKLIAIICLVLIPSMCIAKPMTIIDTKDVVAPAVTVSRSIDVIIIDDNREFIDFRVTDTYKDSASKTKRVEHSQIIYCNENDNPNTKEVDESTTEYDKFMTGAGIDMSKILKQLQGK